MIAFLLYRLLRIKRGLHASQKEREEKGGGETFLAFTLKTLLVLEGAVVLVGLRLVQICLTWLLLLLQAALYSL